MRIDLEDLGFDEGGHLLLKRALRQVAVGQDVEVYGRAEALEVNLAAWTRTQGHGLRLDTGAVPSSPGTRAIITRGPADTARWAGAERAGRSDPSEPGAVVEHPPQRWGLAARGATVEAGAPDYGFRLATKSDVWADDAIHLYAQAVAAQWDPNTVIPWDAEFELADDVEDAVVQVMTYLVENEVAALVVPSRFVAELHPHFREVMQLLAIQAADEARHVEVFTRRACLKRARLGTSSAGGQTSLKTLVDEPDFSIASFLLSVLGEGTFLTLLWFLERHAPDPITRAVTRLAAQDEARHVAFGVAHLRESLKQDPDLKERLAQAVRRRHDELRHTVGLNAEVFDGLVLLAAGGWEHAALRHGSQRVSKFLVDMDEARPGQLTRLGFDADEAAELSGLHTRNFM